MQAISKILGTIVSILVVIGVVKGIGEADMPDGFDLQTLLTSIINGIADLTVFLIPQIIQAISNAGGVA